VATFYYFYYFFSPRFYSMEETDNDHPSGIFQYDQARTRGDVNKICNDLRNYGLKTDQKRWILDGLDGKFNDDVRWSNLSLNSAADVAERYNISKQAISNWRARLRAGLTLHESKGKPPTFSKKATDFIKSESSRLRYEEQKPPSKKKLLSILTEAKKMTHLENGGVRNKLSSVLAPCPSVVKNFVRDNMYVRTAQRLTDARNKALSDPITSISFAILLLANGSSLPASAKINFDGTIVGISDDGSRKVYISRSDPKGVVSTTEKPGLTTLFIKLMHIIAACGIKGPLVNIVAMGCMPPDTFIVKRVPGLCNTADHKNHGFLYTCQTRAGCASMWKHFFLNVIIPFAKEMGDLTSDCDVRPFFTLLRKCCSFILFS
jgi:hypothetical protein